MAATSSGNRNAELKALRFAVAMYVVVTAIKFAAYAATSMLALLAEALHTFSDVLVSSVLWIALRYSRKGPDEKHPFGHGRAQYVGALVAATLFVSFTSLELIREAVPKLLHPSTVPPTNVPIALAVLAVSMVLAGFPLVSLMRHAQGEAARAQLLELVNDQLGLLAASIGTILVWRGVAVADPLAALVVAIIIGGNGIVLFRDNLSLLLGRAPTPEIMEQLREKVLSTPGVRGMHGLRAEMTGTEAFHAELHVEVDRGQLVEEAHAIADEVEARLRSAHPLCQITVHVDVFDGAGERKSDPPAARLS